MASSSPAIPATNEVGPHNRPLQIRYIQNPVASWVGQVLENNRRRSVPEFHLDLYDSLCTCERMVVKAPRSFAKTTICAENFVIYLAATYGKHSKMADPPAFPHRKVFVISETGPKAEEIMQHIKIELETNEELIAEYGVFVPPRNSNKKWTERLIQTNQGFELRVGGRGCQIRGFRPSLVIIDDIEDDEEVRSDDQRDKLEQWFDRALINTLDEIECQCFVIGTTLHPLCLLNYLERKPGWTNRSYMAYVDGIQELGHELWPSKWPHKRLQKRKAEIDHERPGAFRAEFMNDPIVSENPIFVREWFEKYSPEDEAFSQAMSTGLHTLISCDPAISKRETADYTAIVSISARMGDKPGYFVRSDGVIRGHWPINRTVSELIRVYDSLGASGIVVETTAYQEALADEVTRYADEHHRNIPVISVKPDKDKERRAHAVAPMLERSEVFFDHSDPMQRKLMDELFLFPTGSHDDLVDAFVHCLTEQKRWQGSQHKQTSPHIALPPGQRGVYTGMV